MNHDIVVAAEQRDGIVQKISFELIHGAAEVAGQTGGRVITVIAGFEIRRLQNSCLPREAMKSG